MVHEVAKSHKNAFMFCLGCDNFFKVSKKSKDIKASSPDEDISKTSLHEKNKILSGIIEKKRKKKSWQRLKSQMKFFAKKLTPKIKIKQKPAPETNLGNERIIKEIRSVEPRAYELINNFLGPEADLSISDEAAPAEYVDFMNSGLDAFSSDLVKNHNQRRSEQFSSMDLNKN
jgi:hypothetical protein